MDKCNGMKIKGKIPSVGFDLRGAEVVVSRADNEEHVDPVIGSFLLLLENDIKSGRHVASLPEDLAQTMLDNLHHAVVIDEDIDGEVAL